MLFCYTVRSHIMFSSTHVLDFTLCYSKSSSHYFFSALWYTLCFSCVADRIVLNEKSSIGGEGVRLRGLSQDLKSPFFFCRVSQFRPISLAPPPPPFMSVRQKQKSLAAWGCGDNLACSGSPLPKRCKVFSLFLLTVHPPPLHIRSDFHIQHKFCVGVY